jgi:hypothetical protein
MMVPTFFVGVAVEPRPHLDEVSGVMEYPLEVVDRWICGLDEALWLEDEGDLYDGGCILCLDVEHVISPFS